MAERKQRVSHVGVGLGPEILMISTGWAGGSPLYFFDRPARRLARGGGTRLRTRCSSARSSTSH